VRRGGPVGQSMRAIGVEVLGRRERKREIDKKNQSINVSTLLIWIIVFGHGNYGN